MATAVVVQVTLMGHSAGAQLSAMALLQRVATAQQASKGTGKVNGTISDPRMPLRFVGEHVWATPLPSLALFISSSCCMRGCLFWMVIAVPLMAVLTPCVWCSVCDGTGVSAKTNYNPVKNH
jgi:hypothetical protein